MSHFKQKLCETVIRNSRFNFPQNDKSKCRRYFDDNDVNDWSILGFYEAWIHDNKNDIKKLSYQKANDVLTKSLRSLINDCKDEIKIQEATKLLANKASTSCTSYVVHARRNQLFAGPLNACLDA
ncbi:16478_t:CDS:2 [Gigaspora rosea]|nr:16478_t:CDS:2 [Gigaspora rosea]